VLKDHAGPISALAFAPKDGKLLASGSHDRTARLWDVSSGECKQVLKGHTDRVSDLAFDPGGRRLVTAALDQTGRVWWVDGGKLLHQLSHQKPGEKAERLRVEGVAWSPDGKTVASCTDAPIIWLWQPNDGKLHKQFSGPNRPGESATHYKALTFTKDSSQ